MLSIKSLGAAGSGVEAYYEHLAQDDYYENGGEPPGQWQGSLAAKLFLFGSVRSGQLGQMFRGFHPLTGDALAANAGEQHKVGWDLTFSAPKSVSIAWAFSSDEARRNIEDAHNKAVTVALEYLEQRALSSRDREQFGQPIKAILAATYQHGTSRELDPQLHTHAAVANLGMRADGTFCALDFDTRYKMAGGAIYRAELAAHLMQLGYSIERDSRSFRIAGVEQSVCDVFSKRRSQIVERLQQTGYSSAKAASFAALDTRQAKELTDRQSLFQAWREEAECAGIDLSIFDGRQLLQTHDCDLQGPTSIDIDAILKNLTAQASTFTRMQFEAAIAVESQGLIDASQVQELVSVTIASKIHDQNQYGMVRLQEHPGQVASTRRQTERFTTREMLEIERNILDQALARQDESSHVVSCQDVLIKYSTLSGEQSHALMHITEEVGAVKAVCGLAGTGKSFMLRAAKESWEASNFTVIGAALAGKAAQSLEDGSGIKSQTLHSLLDELAKGKRVLASTDVVVIDEAGMIGSRQLHQILNHIHQAGAKAVLVGDPMQLQPIDAGGIFRSLSDKLGFASLTDIRRQKSEVDRKMIHDLIDGRSESVLTSLAERGMLVSAQSENVHSVIVSQWAQELNPDAMHQSLMLAGTKADVYKVNMFAREKLLQQQFLHSEVSVTTGHGERALAVGERILFTRNSRKLGIKNGETGTLKKWELDQRGNVRLDINTDNGKKVSINLSEYGHIDYGYALSVHKAQGQTVDKVYLLLSEAMTDREWAYVGASRHRDQLRVYFQDDLSEDLSKLLRTSHKKEVTQDYAVIDTHTGPLVNELEAELGE
jgi:conjugative relaxase-like TrwC/TraI family protein